MTSEYLYQLLLMVGGPVIVIVGLAWMYARSLKRRRTNNPRTNIDPRN